MAGSRKKLLRRVASGRICGYVKPGGGLCLASPLSDDGFCYRHHGRRPPRNAPEQMSPAMDATRRLLSLGVPPDQAEYLASALERGSELDGELAELRARKALLIQEHMRALIPTAEYESRLLRLTREIARVIRVINLAGFGVGGDETDDLFDPIRDAAEYSRERKP